MADLARDECVEVEVEGESEASDAGHSAASVEADTTTTKHSPSKWAVVDPGSSDGFAVLTASTGDALGHDVRVVRSVRVNVSPLV